MKRVHASSAVPFAAVFALTSVVTLSHVYADDTGPDPSVSDQGKRSAYSSRSRIETRGIRDRHTREAGTYPATRSTAQAEEETFSAFDDEPSVKTSRSAAERTAQAGEGQGATTGDTGRDFVGKQMFVAPKLGAVFPIDLGGYDTQFTWGGEVGFRAGEKITLGVNVLTSSADIGPAKARVTPIMLRMGYYPNLGNGFYIGPQVGMVKESTALGGTAIQGSDTEFGAGVVLGYDYQITPIFSTGIEINHATVFGEPDIYQLISLVVPFKVHF